MKKILTTVFLCCVVVYAMAQKQRKIAIYLSAQFNGTIYDGTMGNNPWGIGAGLRTCFNNIRKLKPTVEITRSVYFADDKLLRLNPDGSIPTRDNAVNSMNNVFGGVSFFPNQHIYVSLLAGPSFISGRTLLGIEPSFGFYFSPSKRWTGKISYINIFNRYQLTNEDFGSIGAAVAYRLF